MIENPSLHRRGSLMQKRSSESFAAEREVEWSSQVRYGIRATT
jgi:hypothetical protein